MINEHINRIHYRIKSQKKPPEAECCKNVIPYAVCALGASAVTAGVIASCALTRKKYFSSPKKW